MESAIIELTKEIKTQGNLRLTKCKALFPQDALGNSSRAKGIGKPLNLKPYGLDTIIRTDIPAAESGNRKWIFRDQSWVKEFVNFHDLKPGDKVRIQHIHNRTYEIIPAKTIRFIDLFAGIGGTRLAFEKAGCKCIFSSEWNKYAAQTYEANYGELPHGDITKIESSEIPDHDILVAGFPCQPFSISGVSKKNSLGKPHGFDDPTQGTLFFEIKRILKDKRPSAFLLENVKNLRSHDKGMTYKVIRQALEKDLGYTVFEQVIDADTYVPQHRERIFIVGFKEPTSFTFPNHRPVIKPKLRDILEKNVPECYTLTDHLWNYLQRYAEKHRANGNGFGFGMANLDGHTRTLSARYYKDGSEILIPQGPGKNPRRLTPKECAKLMGFTQLNPDFKIPVSDTQAYKQFGNSVVVPLIHDVAKAMIKALL